MIYIFYITILSSLALCLSDEQIEKIKLTTDDADYAPNFTLNSIEDRDFSDIIWYITKFISGLSCY